MNHFLNYSYFSKALHFYRLRNQSIGFLIVQLNLNNSWGLSNFLENLFFSEFPIFDASNSSVLDARRIFINSHSNQCQRLWLITRILRMKTEIWPLRPRIQGKTSNIEGLFSFSFRISFLFEFWIYFGQSK